MNTSQFYSTSLSQFLQLRLLYSRWKPEKSDQSRRENVFVGYEPDSAWLPQNAIRWLDLRWSFECLWDFYLHSSKRLQNVYRNILKCYIYFWGVKPCNCYHFWLANVFLSTFPARSGKKNRSLHSLTKVGLPHVFPSTGLIWIWKTGVYIDWCEMSNAVLTPIWPEKCLWSISFEENGCLLRYNEYD